MKVRIVEDTEDIASLMKILLETEQFEVSLTSRNFSDLLNPEPWEGIEAVLLDLSLPEVSGLEVLRYLRGQEPQVRRVVLTALSPQDISQQVTDFAEVVLFKPAPMEAIVKALKARN